jgi:hypothetical protein
MAKTSYQEIPAELDTNYKKALQSSDRFTFPRVRRKLLFSTRTRIKGVTQKSLFPQVLALWNSFDNSTRDAWTLAGEKCGLTGLKVFTQDQCMRIKNNMSGVSTPSLLHQYKFGRLHIESPANKIKITQLHPLDYYVLRKVPKTRSQYESILISESFALPLELRVNYKSNLVASGGVGSAKIYLRVLSHYQGRDIFTDCNIDFTLSSDWTFATSTLSSVLGVVRGYNAFIDLENVQGDLYIDNVVFSHSAFNWARDKYCNDINQGFTKAFYQVAKNWVAVDLPDGAQFDSFFE